jgi:4-amino-4-deoxychorismate lyase
VTGRRLVNGLESSAVAADDRGLQYGDGLFETMLVGEGRIRHLELHLARLEEGCRKLALPMPSAVLIRDECERAMEGLRSGVVKFILTRGPGPRGYRPPAEPAITRIVMASAPRPRSETHGPVTVRLCRTRLGLNPALAGLKHLNRLEQVMACAEWDDPRIAEGLMLSTDGRVVCATAANVFVVTEGRLVTPAIRDCGVAGVMREVVLRAARQAGIPAEVQDVYPDDLEQAQEAFLTNAVIGVRPIEEVVGLRRWADGEVTRTLSALVTGGGG